MKKIVALLLSLCLVLGAASAMAAGEKIALITMALHRPALDHPQRGRPEGRRGTRRDRYFHVPQHQG